MILEKLKQHGGKIMFFVMNILVVALGVLFIKQKNTEKINATVTKADVQNYTDAANYAAEVQQRIVDDQQAKINSINDNTGTIQKDQTVSVTRAIPAVTKTITVQQPVVSSPAKATTKKS